jgi:hypothetical protein
MSRLSRCARRPVERQLIFPLTMITLKQYRRLLAKYAETQTMSISALKAGVDPGV